MGIHISVLEKERDEARALARRFMRERDEARKEGELYLSTLRNHQGAIKELDDELKQMRQERDALAAENKRLNDLYGDVCVNVKLLEENKELRTSLDDIAVHNQQLQECLEQVEWVNGELVYCPWCRILKISTFSTHRDDCKRQIALGYTAVE